jgi:hypothetical protein
MAMPVWWNVYLNGKLIDSVPYEPSYKHAAEVKRSLVNHDGYDSEIVVRKRPAKAKKAA